MKASLFLGAMALLFLDAAACKNRDEAPSGTGGVVSEPASGTATPLASSSSAPTPPTPSETTALPSPPPAATSASAKAAASASPSAKAASNVGPTASAPAALAPSATAPAAPAAASAPTPAVANAKPVGARVSGSHFTVDFVAPGDCKTGGRCNAALTLRATEGYHINNSYPYKFVANDANVEFLGKEGKTFSKAGGEFAKTSETSAQMAVTFQGKSPGTVKVAGTFKMSVCSEANCQIETPTVALDVPMQ